MYQTRHAEHAYYFGAPAPRSTTGASREVRQQVDVGHEHGQDDEQDDATKDDDQDGLDQLTQVLDHVGDLFLVVVGEANERLRDLAGLLAGVQDRDDVDAEPALMVDGLGELVAVEDLLARPQYGPPERVELH